MSVGENVRDDGGAAKSIAVRTPRRYHGGIVRFLILPFALLLILPADVRSQLSWRAPPEWEVWCASELEEVALADRETAERQLVEYLLASDPDVDEAKLRRSVGQDLDVLLNLFRACIESESARQRVEEVLERDSRWLKSLGFGGPAIFPSAPPEVVDRFPYLSVRSPNCELFYCAVVAYGDHRELGWYEGDSGFLYVTPKVMADALGFAHSGTTVGEVYTAAHELFHAIQRGYDIPLSDSHGWIVEGTADQVEVAAERKWGSVGTSGRWRRHYDAPLHRPPAGGGEALDRWQYGTWFFWDFVGQYLASPDRIAYLREVLQADLGPDHGITGVHNGLRSAGAPTGIYEVYPEFVRQRLNRRQWFNESVEDVLELPEGEDSKEGDDAGTVEPVAAEFLKLITRVPEGRTDAWLTIRLAPESGGRLEDLHLVVDDRIVKRRTEGAFEYSQDLPAGEDEFAIRVANVARNPAESEKIPYELTYRIDTCGEIQLGDFAARVDGARSLKIERNRRINAAQVHHPDPFGRWNLILDNRADGDFLFHVVLPERPAVGQRIRVTNPFCLPTEIGPVESIEDAERIARRCGRLGGGIGWSEPSSLGLVSGHVDIHYTAMSDETVCGTLDADLRAVREDVDTYPPPTVPVEISARFWAELRPEGEAAPGRDGMLDDFLEALEVPAETRKRLEDLAMGGPDRDRSEPDEGPSDDPVSDKGAKDGDPPTDPFPPGMTPPSKGPLLEGRLEISGDVETTVSSRPGAPIGLTLMCQVGGSSSLFVFELPDEAGGGTIQASTANALGSGETGDFPLDELVVLLPNEGGATLLRGNGRLVLERHRTGEQPRLEGRLTSPALRGVTGEEANLELSFRADRACVP